MIPSPEDRTLELACTVGSLENAIEAIEEGANVNYQGGAPLFLAIVNRNRAIINMLLDHGAVPDAFLPVKKLRLIKGRDTLVEELIASAPSNPRDIKPDQIEEIDQAIRDEGVSYLLSNIDWDRATFFRDSLDAIGAGQTHRCVAEFLQWARSEHGLERDGLIEFIAGHAPLVNEYRDRYLSSGEDLVSLANDYLNS
jgi:ankyrin repeat protein